MAKSMDNMMDSYMKQSEDQKEIEIIKKERTGGYSISRYSVSLSFLFGLGRTWCVVAGVRDGVVGFLSRRVNVWLPLRQCMSVYACSEFLADVWGLISFVDLIAKGGLMTKKQREKLEAAQAANEGEGEGEGEGDGASDEPAPSKSKRRGNRRMKVRLFVVNGGCVWGLYPCIRACCAAARTVYNRSGDSCGLRLPAR